MNNRVLLGHKKKDGNPAVITGMNVDTVLHQAVEGGPRVTHREQGEEGKPGLEANGPSEPPSQTQRSVRPGLVQRPRQAGRDSDARPPPWTPVLRELWPS